MDVFDLGGVSDFLKVVIGDMGQTGSINIGEIDADFLNGWFSNVGSTINL